MTPRTDFSHGAAQIYASIFLLLAAVTPQAIRLGLLAAVVYVTCYGLAWLAWEYQQSPRR